ncbi:MAG: HAMP domain-containing histidine kinase, partial [Deltaproteobacteria bacterium]|nr:HAMP domain-containing histidine kinase [Deltaproteobacteria bacterium]
LNLQEEMEQRQRAERETLEALEKEKELNELKSRFVSMASHEFRTPLSAILTSVSLIDRYHLPEDEKKRAKHVQTIKSSVHSLTNILNDFLSLDKLEKGKVEYRPSQFDLVGFATELADEMQELAKPGQRIVYRHTGCDGPVFLDKHMFRGILINLLSNAIKYSDEGQEISFTSEMDLTNLTLTVQDHGIGIPESDQKHLFETFFRGKNVASIQGTGLGLNIVKRCLDLMDGRIQFSSEVDEGSTFKIFLPKTKKA